MKYSWLLLFVIGFHLNVHSQQQKNITQYFDKYWQPVRSAAEASYYRAVDNLSDKFLVTDYYSSNDAKQMTAECSKVVPELVFDGEAIWYYPNGKTKEEGFYVNNKRNGLFKAYYEDESPKSEIRYNENEAQYVQYWSQDGLPFLNNGQGSIGPVQREDENPSYMEIQDSRLVASYYIRTQMADTIYLTAEVPSEYKGGMPGFYQELGKELAGKYPRPARRMGIEGRVYIEFIVDKNGTTAEQRVLKGIGGGCDEVALDALKKLNKWKPAHHKGKPVKSIMVLPVAFRLT